MKTLFQIYIGVGTTVNSSFLIAHVHHCPWRCGSAVAAVSCHFAPDNCDDWGDLGMIFKMLLHLFPMYTIARGGAGAL